MNKSEFIGAVATRLGGTKEEAGKSVEAVLGAIADAVRTEDVKIGGFGAFKRKIRAAHLARNPATGASVDVREKRTVGFKPAKDLEARL